MAAILRPFRNGLYIKRQVPNGALAIDWGHPLAQGLIGAFVPGVSLGINFAGTIDLARRGTPPTYSANFSSSTQEGSAYYASLAGDGLAALAPASWLTQTQSFYWRGVCSSSTSIGLLGVQYSDPEGAPYWFQGLTHGGGVIRGEWNSGGGYTAGSGVSEEPGVFRGYGVTFPGAGGNVLLYKDGVQQTTTAFGASAPTSSATSTIILNSSTADNGRDISSWCNVAYAWNRALSAAEMAWIDAEPYAFLIPAEAELPALFVSGGAETVTMDKWFRPMLHMPRPNQMIGY